MKRLNVKLLIWIIVITGVALGVIYGLHSFQVQRNSGSFLKLAEQAEADNELNDAASFYGQYLRYHEDDAKVQVKYALVLAQLSEQPEGEAYIQPAMGSMLRALQLDANNLEARGKYVKLLLSPRVRRIDDAEAQLEILRKSDPKNNEWDKLLSECRLLVGKYPEAAELLQQAIVTDPQDVAAYRQLAAIQRERLDDKEAMNKTLDEMIAANPESSLAHLLRYEFRRQDGRLEEARPDLQKALELSPDDLSALLASAEAAVRDKELDKAVEYLEAAIKAHPTNTRPYLLLAQLERLQNRTAEAIAQFERGLKAAPDSPELTVSLFETKLASGDTEGAAAMLDGMKKVGIVDEHIQRFRGQVMIAQGKHLEALTLLNGLRPKLTATPYLPFVDLLRAQCYGALGQADLQLEAYRSVLFTDPNNRTARVGMADALSRTGKSADAVQELEALAGTGDVAAALSLLEVLISQQLREPADKRDWSRADALLQQLAEKLPDNQRLKTLQVEYLVQKGDGAAARELLDKSLAANPKDVGLWMARINLASLEEGDAGAARKEIAAAREAVGDLPNFRIAEIGLLLRQGDDAAKKSLDEIAAGIDSLPEAEQPTMRQSVANAYNLFGERTKAFAMFEDIAKRSPDDLMARLNAFRVARDDNNDELMKKSLDQLKALVGEKDTYWLYGEAARIVSAVAKKQAPPEELEKARKLIQDALVQRPNWGPLESLIGEIDQRQGNLDGAIAHYQKAFELGDQTAKNVNALVVLLVARNRAEEAERVVNGIPRAKEILGPRVNAMLAMVQGEQEEALASAKQAVEANKDDFATQLWYGNIMTRARRFPEGEQALLKARELADNVPDVWLALVSHYMQAQNPEAARKTIAEAEGKLPADNKDRTMATAYQMVKDYAKAGPLLEAAVKRNPDDLNLLRQLAAHYELTGEPQKLVDTLKLQMEKGMAAGVKGEGAAHDARRSLTQVLASSRQVPSIRQALEFLQSSSNRLKLDTEDLVLKANLLTQLTDADSRKQAVALLNDIVAQNPGRLNEQVTLARTLNRDGDWPSAKGMMLSVLKQRPDDPNLNLLYAEMLLQHQEAVEAQSYLDAYEKKEGPDASPFKLLKAQLFALQDNPQQAIATANSVLPAPLTPEQIPQLKTIAGLFEGFAARASNPDPYYDAAEKIYREYVKEIPDDSLVLARFVGSRRDIDEALTLCEEAAKKGNSEEAIRTALSVARERSADFTDANKARVQALFDAALKESPDKVGLLILLADYNDLQGNYGQSAKIYQDILKQKDLNGVLRATVLNNLAYLLAIKDGKGDEALPMIEEGIKIVGPLAELIDTRGMVQLTRGQINEAVVDLKRSADESPTPIALYHLAAALLKNDDLAGAEAAYRRAVEAGLEAKDVSKLEKSIYDEVQAKFPN